MLVRVYPSRSVLAFVCPSRGVLDLVVLRVRRLRCICHGAAPRTGRPNLRLAKKCEVRVVFPRV